MADRDFENLLKVIEQLNSQLDRLAERATKIQEKFSSGSFGVDQLKALRVELDKITETFAKKDLKLQNLVKERDIAESTRGFAALEKSISTLELKIRALREERANLGLHDPSGIAEFEREYSRITSAIEKSEKALSSFQSRMRNKYTPLGTLKGAGDTPQKYDVDLEGRLAATAPRPVDYDLEGRLGKSIPEFTASRAKEIRDMGREAAIQMINQLQKEILEGAINARNQAATSPVYNIGTGQTPKPGKQYIPGGFEDSGGLGAEFSALNDRIRRASKAYDKDFFSMSEKEEEEQRLKESLRKRILSESRYAQALKAAESQDFTINNLKRVQTRGTAGVERLQFEKTDPSGIQRNLDLYVNQQGKATAGISNQFRSFGQGVIRDIGELTKWSIALAAVYGPMRKVAELTQTMIENQTRLAEATVSVNSSFLDQGKIFDIAATQANAAGESVEGVIDAFTLAYRAAGGGADQVERLSTAQSLLSSSLVLSKLSTLDQATAIDTLAAALRQTFQGEGGLSKGTELLDKWVRVTKVANVDLASLATGFAVLGDAADAAGINADELNGIIGALGETGVASGRELANTARALVAGFQSDQARKALEGVGVAFEDTSGQARPFLEIMRELSELRQGEIIDDTAFSKLTLALGGGTRRQAAFATFIENFGRVGQIADESSRASGDAQAALAKQLETVQTSLTQLNNAFSSLAQTMGTEGGFLGIISKSVDGVTLLVKGFDSLVSILGKATPAMAAFIATSLILKYRGQGGIQQALFGVGQGFERDPVLSRLSQYGGGNINNVPAAGAGRQFLQNNVLGTNVSSGIFQGIGAALIPALTNFSNKEDRFGGVKAGADIAGGIVGALVAGPAAYFIGAAIGTSIAEVFVNSTIARKTDIFGYQATGLGEAGKPPPSRDEIDLDRALQDAEIKLYESIGFGNEALGRLITSGTSFQEDLVENLNEAIEKGDRKSFEKVLGGATGYGVNAETLLKNTGISRDFLEQAFKERRPVEFTQETYAYGLASPEARRGIDEAKAARTARGDVEGEETAFSRLIEENKNAYKDLIAAIRESSKDQLTAQRISGEVKGADYGRRSQALGGFDTKALNYYTALGDKFIEVNKGVDNASEAFEAFNQIIVTGASDSIPEITSIVGEIQTLINILSDPKLHEEDILNLGGIDAAKQKLEELQETGANLLTDVYDQTRLQGLKIPQVQGDINKPLQTGEYQQVIEVAKQMQDEFYQGFLDIPDDLYDSLKDSFEEWAQLVEDSGDTFFQKVSDIDPQFFQQALSKLIEEGKIQSQQASPFGIQQLNITSQQGANLQSQIDYFTQYLSTNFPQYEQKPEEFGVIFSDYVTDVLHGDNLAVKLALEKLVEINQKQLDGQYNIPEGATFWVPLTAAYYRPQSQGGMGDINIPELDTNTTATEQNTSALNLLGTAFGNMASQFPTYFASEKGLTPIPEELNLKPGQEGINKTFESAGQQLTQQGLELYQKSERDSTYTPQDGGGFSNFIETLKAGLSAAFQSLTGPLGVLQGAVGEKLGTGSIGARIPDTNVDRTQTTRLDIKFESTTQILLDGRIIATAIKPYLAADLLKLEGSQGTITKKYVI